MALSLLASELHLAICLRSFARLRGVFFLRQMRSNCRRIDFYSNILNMFPYDNDIWTAATDYYLHQGGIIFISLSLSLCISRITQILLVGSS